MNDLIEWLRAQVDTDERLAREAGEHAHGSEAWDLVSFVGGDLDPGEHYSLSIGSRALNASTGDAPDGDTPVVVAELAHIANFDPARVLAEVESKRLILATCAVLLAPVPTPVGYPDAARRTKVEVELAEEQAATAALQALALAYRDRPGYRQEWAP